MSLETVKVQSLGARGDGIAVVDGERVFIAGALPGETWQRGPDGQYRCLIPSPRRATPPCKHFGQCGGCLMQHAGPDEYSRWKIGLIERACHQHAVVTPPIALAHVTAGSRRRCVFGIEKDGEGQVRLGYYRLRSHDLIAIDTCLVLAPQIVTALPALRELAALVLAPGGSARLTVLACDQGLDIDIDRRGLVQDPERRAAMAGLAERHGLVRLSEAGEAIVMRAQPTVRLAGVGVPVPAADIFLQAVPEAEAKITALVTEAAAGAKRVVDLFGGIGTLSFAVARTARVLTVDSDRRALDALRAGRDRARGRKQIDTLVRDLFREPLSRTELAPFDCAIFDPPRAGAEAQAKMLARSSIPVLIAVSCNPGTLARDARIVLDRGYDLTAITAIDQFLYTNHVECVAVFKRPATRKTMA